jgi:serine phosphatase RsbU (regulator of sigma subunit)
LDSNAGDRFIVVTDGVTEAISPNDEAFGLERLENSCSEGVKSVEDALHEFVGDSAMSDDYLIVEPKLCADFGVRLKA